MRSASSDTSAPTAVGSGSIVTGLAAEVLIPSPFERDPVCNYERPNLVQFMGTETFRPCKLYRIQPVLSQLVPVFHMDVWRLVPIQAEKEEPVSFHPKNRRHGASLKCSTILRKAIIRC